MRACRLGRALLCAALATARLAQAFAVVQMADRHGERIGRVVRLRNRVEAQQHLHHLRDLRLLRAAVADDRALDLRRACTRRPSTPASIAASIATPRACPSFSALRAFIA